jgi:hypothetical protein
LKGIKGGQRFYLGTGRDQFEFCGPDKWLTLIIYITEYKSTYMHVCMYTHRHTQTHTDIERHKQKPRSWVLLQ